MDRRGLLARWWLMALMHMLALLVLPALSQAGELPQVTVVGPVKATVNLAPDEPVIGDELILELSVEADKGIEVLMPEFGEALERFAIVDFVPKQQIASDGRTTYYQRYTLQPMISGPQSIPPLLIEFIDHRPGQQPSPDDFDAFELLTQRIDFEVASVLPTSATAELKPPLGRLEPRTGGATTFGWWLVAATLGLVVLVAAVSVWRWRRAHRIVRRNAYLLAREAVDELVADRQRTPPTLTMEQFYVAISDVIRGYLENRFNVAAPDLTTDEFLQWAAAGEQLSAEQQALLAEFLTQADRVKFASGGLAQAVATDRDVQRSCQLAVRFLEETRAHAPEVVLTGDQASRETPLARVAGSQPGEGQAHV